MKATTIPTAGLGTKRRNNIFTALTALVASVAAGGSIPQPTAAHACPECVSPFKPGIYLGEAKRVGNGIAYTWVALDDKGKPSAIGVTLSETALEGLSEVPPQNVSEMQREMTMLMLPPQAMKTGFNHVSLDWNAQGHEPSGIYDKPHFDVHFYTIDVATREKIIATGTDVANCQKPVTGGFMPASYVYAKGTEVPMMGGHWINPAAPELHGKPFNHTFIYGSYKGQMVFMEPMITKAFLASHPDVDEEIAVPTSYAKSAYYPMWYGIHHDATRHEVTIALEGMTWRIAKPDATSKPSAAPRSTNVARAKTTPAPVRTALAKQSTK